MKRGQACWLAIGASVALASALWPAADAADPPVRLALRQPAERDEPEYSGVFACLGCHSAGAQTPYEDSLDRFRMDEVLVWHRQDKHSLAYCTLHAPAAQRMGVLLGYDVTKAKECLACHAPRAELRGADPHAAPNYKLAEGVTCEDCHGASRGWHRLHVLKDQWRGLTPEQKKTHGMNDLRDPETRARVCLECHVGDPDSGKFITHEMYAAGHPPLASVDVVGYAEQMPPHWKQAAAQVADDPFLATRQSLAGHLVAGELSVLQAAHAEASRRSIDPPDFAVFDCDACHHELASPSWRLARGARGVPGRPAYREWSQRSATSATILTADDATRTRVLELNDQLHATLQARPFGIGEGSPALHVRQTLATTWLEQAGDVARRPLSQVDVDRVVVTVLGDARDAERPPDYDTARVMAWLLRTALADLGAFDPDEPSPAQLAWQDLEMQLGLKVPERVESPASEGIRIACPAEPSQPIIDTLPATLASRANYDPRLFQSNLRQFTELVRQSRTAQAVAERRRRQ